MPSLITHDQFGQDVYRDLFRSIGSTRDEAEAFLLGNQGPDPLFYAVVSPGLRSCNRLGSTMHKHKPSRLFQALKQSLEILDEDEASVGRAYALGFVCHYTLDRTAHPFIFWHQYRLCDAGVPGLSRKDGSEVHSLIETELDELVLFAKRGETVATFDPSRDILKASDNVLRVVSKLYDYLAITVYGQTLPRGTFARCTRNFRRVQRLFHSSTGLKRAALSRAEELVRPHSFYRSMSHRALEVAESAFDNRQRETWRDPFTGHASDEGFWDLYHRALAGAKERIALFDRPGFDAQAARELTGDANFSGEPTTAAIVAVEDPAGIPAGAGA